MTKLRFPDRSGGFRGGKRPGAGRPKLEHRRASERHRTRKRIGRHAPLHVILRARPEVGSLRSEDGLQAIRNALIAVFKHEATFRIVHFSAQRTHIHLIAEAEDYLSLARGIKAFAGSVAKHFNALTSKRRGLARRRRGSVFADRYHAVVLQSPTQVRNTLSYVLNNWRHHGEDRAMSAAIDRYSSGIYFDGWKERDGRGFWPTPSGYDIPMVVWAQTFVLKVLWRTKGLISAHAVPGAGRE
jgi:REP element-mobilizing transposase RayT